MSRSKKNFCLLLSAAAASGLIFLIKQHRNKIAGLDDWIKILTSRYGRKKTQDLAAKIRWEHKSLLKETSVPQNRRLRQHLKTNILPGLALYRTLQEYSDNKEIALAETEEIYLTPIRSKSQKMLAPLKVFPAPFRLFKLGFSLVMKQFPKEGWDIDYIENKNKRIAFNITRCYYLNVLTAYGAPELTAMFCKSDDVMAECFPPEIQFIRTQTLGRGHSVCDFLYFCMDKS